MSSPLSLEWESYRAGVVPADASEAQVKECKMAFYAGAVAMVSLMSRDGTIDPATGLAHIVLFSEDLADTGISLTVKSTNDDVIKH